MFKESDTAVGARVRAGVLPASRVPGGTRKVVALVGRCLAVLGILLGTAVVAAPSATAAGSDFLRNWENGRCLDFNFAGEVYTSPCQFGNNYQQWVQLNVQPGNYGHDIAQFKNVATGLYLRFGDYPRTGTNLDNTQTYWAGAGPDWQHAALLTHGGAYDLCLAGDGGGTVWIEVCYGAGYQNWKYGY